MILVLDANILIAALLKDGSSRKVIMSEEFTLLSPEYLIEELEKHKSYITKKTGLSNTDLELLVSLLLKRISIVPHAKYKNMLQEALKIMEKDVRDAPYAACYLALECDAIWTNDSDFHDKQKLKIVATENLIKLLGHSGRT